ncbi:MAG TPA: methyltransferase [Candidatus Limnocylindrales bacterium]|nr:methyltransferase [Candidatus Limnocylindrales bacterium]
MSQERPQIPPPTQILQMATGFWISKVLLSAAELGLFTELGSGPLSYEEIRRRLNLHPRSARDFLDALVSVGLLQREGDQYANSELTAVYLDRARPTYIGGFLEMCERRLYPFWGRLTDALRSGVAQNESGGADDFFASIYSTPDRLRGFLQAMTGISKGAAVQIASKFPWDRYRTFADIGCAQGCVPVELAETHAHLSGIGFDLAAVGPVFDEFVASRRLSERLRFVAGDFFADPLPQADVLIMGHILHDWNLEEKKTLLKKAHDALPSGGSLIVYEALIDDDRRSNTFGLLMSLNMLIETPGGFDYTGADCTGWMKEIGFRETRVEYLDGPDSMVIGVK